MTLNTSILDETRRGFREAFFDQLGQADRPWEMFVNRIPTTRREEVLKWVSRNSGVQEWLGDRVYDKARAYEHRMTVKTWQDGLEVPREDIEDEATASYNMVIRDMADNFVQHKMERMISFLTNGFAATNGLAYDGQFFFDSDHQDGPDGVTQSNVATAALSESAFKTARATGAKLLKPNGKRARIRYTHLMVGPDLQGTAEDIFDRQFLSSGANNPLYKAVDIIVEPELADNPTHWYLFDLGKAMKPFAFLDRRPVNFTAKDNLSDDAVVDQNVFRYAADARYEIDYWAWQTAYGSDGTT